MQVCMSARCPPARRYTCLYTCTYKCSRRGYKAPPRCSCRRAPPSSSRA
ncbi:hypothetical protein E2C01_079904 [Portunus trituberculatus]|uniref:Uncharacterized protein n=1 Tax=Portunus trituberculatus TaxID=210409 RepID=A0A5B7II34_PORTR|nr:hypothetical protein [Portunus trituberculatus]